MYVSCSFSGNCISTYYFMLQVNIKKSFHQKVDKIKSIYRFLLIFSPLCSIDCSTPVNYFELLAYRRYILQPFIKQVSKQHIGARFFLPTKRIISNQVVVRHKTMFWAANHLIAICKRHCSQ